VAFSIERNTRLHKAPSIGFGFANQPKLVSRIIVKVWNLAIGRGLDYNRNVCEMR
jgi:hypothetical protein